MRSAAMEIEYLIHCLANPSMRRRHSAVRQLVRIGADAVPALIEATTSPSKEIRLDSAWALARIADPRSYEAIVAQLIFWRALAMKLHSSRSRDCWQARMTNSACGG